MPTCSYCGALADTKDHVVPVSYNKLVDRRTRKGVSYRNTVDCCQLCNSLLGNVLIDHIAGRAAYLAHRYKARYRTLLNSPAWEPADLAELGPRLRQKIIDDIQQQKEMQERIAYLEARASA